MAFNISSNTGGAILGGLGAGLEATGTALQTGKPTSIVGDWSGMFAPSIDIGTGLVGAVLGGGLAMATKRNPVLGAVGGGLVGAVIGPYMAGL